MIVDSIKNRSLYGSISPGIKKALDYLSSLQAGEFVEQKVEIEGSDLFALFQEYRTESDEGKLYEAHDRYIDIQFILSGREVIRVSGRSALNLKKPYDDGKDIMFYALGPGTDVVLGAGDFAVLFPEDAHIPKLSGGKYGEVKKVVMKVRTSG